MSEEAAIRVLIVDDHPVVQDGYVRCRLEKSLWED